MEPTYEWLEDGTLQATLNTENKRRATSLTEALSNEFHYRIKESDRIGEVIDRLFPDISPIAEVKVLSLTARKNPLALAISKVNSFMA